MLRIELLPAHHGDAILIEYGKKTAPHRILIDGGTPESFDAVKERLARIAKVVALELMVVTHVDEDHIGGSLALLHHKPKLIKPKDVWFNAWKHLFPPDVQGPVQGEALSTAIERGKFPWNKKFKGGSVVVPSTGKLPVVKVADATITLLSPTWPKLEKMRKTWEKDVKRAKLVPGEGAEPDDVLGKRPPPQKIVVGELAGAKFKQDGSAANGSSIAFLFEHAGKRVLFAADAHPKVLEDSIARLGKGPLVVDAWKVAHHGSQKNTSDSVLGKVKTSRYLISTDSGTFGHPDPEAIARLVRLGGKKSVFFNYDTPYTRPWSDITLREDHGYEAVYCEPDADGHLTIEL
jgi:hypothetical protein